MTTVPGHGAFQPPSAAELTAAYNTIAELRSDLADAKRRARPVVDTGGDLEVALHHIMSGLEFEVDIDTDGDDNLTVTLEGLTLDGDEIVQQERQFEVYWNVSLNGKLTVTARDELTADGIADGILADYVSELETVEPREDDEVYDSRVSTPDLDYRFDG